MNLLRRFLPVLCALAANSPYWEGRDTGFDSYRTEVWAAGRARSTGAFESRAQYEGLVDRLVESGVILDRAMAYFDVALGRFPTLEIRIADVMPTVDDVVAVAGWPVYWLPGACARTSGAAAAHEFLRAATWRAARSGLGGTSSTHSTAPLGPRAMWSRASSSGWEMTWSASATTLSWQAACVPSSRRATARPASAAPTPTTATWRRARGAHLGPDGSPGGDEA